MRVETAGALDGTRHGSGFDADDYRVTVTTKAGKVLIFMVDGDGFWELREGGLNQSVVPEIKAKGRL